MLLLKAAVMGLVEGLTEFLPISSTGHLILAGALLGFDDEKAKVFDIAIQTGAILAVVIVYWEKIKSTVLALPTQRLARRFALNVLIAFLPAVVLGLLFGKAIKAHLFTPSVVASTFIIGGFIILWVEGWGRQRPEGEHPDDHARILNVETMAPLDALKVGLVQCLAMGLCALVVALHRHPQLRGVCLVPHRFWGGGFSYCVQWLGGLAALVFDHYRTQHIENGRFHGCSCGQGAFHGHQMRAVDGGDAALGDALREVPTRHFHFT